MYENNLVYKLFAQQKVVRNFLISYLNYVLGSNTGKSSSSFIDYTQSLCVELQVQFLSVEAAFSELNKTNSFVNKHNAFESVLAAYDSLALLLANRKLPGEFYYNAEKLVGLYKIILNKLTNNRLPSIAPYVSEMVLANNSILR